MTHERTKAPAKARLITLAMRTASELGVSAQAQAILAHIVAESWAIGDGWIANMTNAELQRRLSASRSSIKRWTAELENHELVRRRPGTTHVSAAEFQGVTIACPGDANGDAQVDGADLLDVVNNFGATGAPGIPGDVNLDGQTDGGDLLDVVNNFGTTCP